jgi:hypothetical protein
LIDICFQDEDTLKGVTRKKRLFSWNIKTGEAESREMMEPNPYDQSSIRRPFLKARFSVELGILAIAHRGDPIYL